MSLMASLVTTSRMQQCFNVPIDSNHDFLLLFYCCVLLEIKLTTTTIVTSRSWMGLWRHCRRRQWLGRVHCTDWEWDFWLECPLRFTPYIDLGLCLGYVPALAYGSCRVSDQGTTLRASDLHNARATILNPFNNVTWYLYPYYDIENTGLYNWKYTWNQTGNNNTIKSSNTPARPHQLLLCMSLRKSLF